MLEIFSDYTARITSTISVEHEETSGGAAMVKASGLLLDFPRYTFRSTGIVEQLTRVGDIVVRNWPTRSFSGVSAFCHTELIGW